MVRPLTSMRSAPACDATSPGSISVFLSHLIFIIPSSFSCRLISSMTLPVHPSLPIQSVGFRCLMRALPGMRHHHRIAGLVSAAAAGDHHSPPVNPDPHIHALNKKMVAVSAEPAPQIPVDPHAVAHGYSPGDLHIAVAQGRVCAAALLCHPEEEPDAFLCDLFHFRPPRFSLCHYGSYSH